MTLPAVQLEDGLADEAAIVSTLAALAVLRGWTVTPAGGITWFLSRGSSGDKQIVGGLEPTGTRQFKGYTAADLDQDGIVSGTVKGYVNDDSANTTAIGAKILSDTDGASYSSRSAGQPVTLVAAVSADAIACIYKFKVSGVIHQAFVYIGSTKSVGGRGLQREAYARIAAIDASTPATTIITLDRDINAALKDGYLGDPYPNNAPLFQSVSGLGMPVTDFALVQRISILAGSLTLSGGATQFQIDATAAGKLTGTPGGTTARYKAGRGVGDIVRLMSEPNITIVNEVVTGGILSGSGRFQISAWDAAGGQGSAILLKIGSADASLFSSNHPAGEDLRFVNYNVYASITTKKTGMVTQSDNDGLKDVGVLFNVIQASFASGDVSDFGIIEIDQQHRKRYRHLTIGFAGTNNLSSGFMFSGVGPGW